MRISTCIVVCCFLAAAFAVAYAAESGEKWPLTFTMAMLLIGGAVALIADWVRNG